jgi:spermidine synthase
VDDRPRIEYYNWYPLGAVGVDELKRLRQPVEPYLTGNSIAGLDTARTVANAILDEHKATADGDKSAARAALRVAVKLEPNNSYVGFLDRKLHE